MPSMSAAVTAIEQAGQDIGMPAGVFTTFQGAALAFERQKPYLVEHWR